MLDRRVQSNNAFVKKQTLREESINAINMRRSSMAKQNTTKNQLPYRPSLTLTRELNLTFQQNSLVNKPPLLTVTQEKNKEDEEDQQSNIADLLSDLGSP